MRHGNSRSGFTLIELLVVLSVLVLLSGLVVVKLDDVYDRSKSSTQAYGLADMQRQIEIYYGLNHKYPEGWDSLLASTGSATTTPTPALTRYSKLSADLTKYFAASPLTLTPDQITSLKNGGISHLFVHATASTVIPSDSGTERHHTGDPAVAGHDGTYNLNQAIVIDKTLGSKGLALLMTDFGLNANASDSTTVVPTRIAANEYVVYGFGLKNILVQSQVLEAPFFDQVNSKTLYSRGLAVFEVSNVAGNSLRPKLVGVIGPDGRARKASQEDFLNGVTAH